MMCLLLLFIVKLKGVGISMLEKVCVVVLNSCRLRLLVLMVMVLLLWLMVDDLKKFSGVSVVSVFVVRL